MGFHLIATIASRLRSYPTERKGQQIIVIIKKKREQRTLKYELTLIFPNV